MSGTLHIVSTPVGNLEDITLRALRILGEVDVVLAEDTRHTIGLLRHHGIEADLRAFHAHSGERVKERVLQELAEGRTFALVSDAGTPLLSDPGAELVQAAIAVGAQVVPIPGASAALAALVVAGLRSDRFRFLGFPARSGRRRRELLQAIVGAEETQIVYESPRRVRALLEELAPELGDRPVALARELTKLHEEVVRGTAGEVLAALPDEGPRGEIVLLIGGREAPEEADPEEIDEFLRQRVAAGDKPRVAAKAAASRFGLTSRDAYQKVLSLDE